MKTLTKIRISTQEVIESQSHPTHILTAGHDEELVEIESDTRPICGQVKDGDGVRNKRPDEIQVPENDPEEVKREQDYQSALNKLATAAGLSKDEKEALKASSRADIKADKKREVKP